MSDYEQPIWADEMPQHTSIQAGDAAMAAAKKAQSLATAHNVENLSGVSLMALVSQLDEYSRKQVVESIVRNVVTEIARTEMMVDNVEIGEDCVMDLKGERPGPDAVAEGRTLSEKQIEFLGRLHNNLEVLNDIVLMLVDVNEANEGEMPSFGLEQVNGEWKPIKQFSKAKDAEYRRAVQTRLKKAESARESAFSPNGAMAIIEQQRKKAASRTSRLG